MLVQLIGLLGTALFFLSYQCKSSKRLFQVQFASYLCYTIHLLLLGAVTGGVSYLINTLRSLCLGSSRKFLRSYPMCLLLCLAQLITMTLTWSGWISLLPVAANIAATLAGYTRDGQKIRLAGMLINSPLWILYDTLVGSWAGLLDEAVTEGSILLSIFRYGWRALGEKEPED